jgi:hypothetical protein
MVLKYCRMGAPVPYLLVSLAYVVSRAVLWWAGLPFVFALDWMWLADTADLRDRLAETLWYFHAFPPGMDLLTGLLLKVGGSSVAPLAHAVFWVIGLGLANLMVTLGLAVGLGAPAAVGVTIAFLLTPPTIYFEHLYLYEWPIVTLLVLSAVCFHRACLHPSRGRWAVFFVVCAVIAVTRSTFHLVWIAAMVGGALVVSSRGGRRAALLGALPGILLVLSVYAKNAVLFGEFAASTFGPAGFHLVTVGRMPLDERARDIAARTLSPFAAISPYAPPRQYAALFGRSDLPGWPPQVTRLDHVTVPAPNFNHWFILEAHRARRRDVAAYLRTHPGEYLQNAWAGFVAMLGPSTEWHPRTGTPVAPHAAHQAVLGGYTRAYNSAVHGWLAPVGAYIALPVVLIASLWRARTLWRAASPAARARGALVAYCVANIVFVLAISSLATFLESSRYRFQVEPFIWVLATVALTPRRD